MQSCATNSWLRQSMVWHWWPLWGSSSSCQQQQPGLAPLEKKGSCHLLHLQPKKLLPICQLVSMGTRAKRGEPAEAVGRGGRCQADCEQDGNPSCSGWEDTCRGHSHSLILRTRKEWGPCKHWTPWHVERPFVQSGPLEGERPVPRWYSLALRLNHVCPRTHVYFLT